MELTKSLGSQAAGISRTASTVQKRWVAEQHLLARLTRFHLKPVQLGPMFPRIYYPGCFPRDKAQVELLYE